MDQPEQKLCTLFARRIVNLEHLVVRAVTIMAFLINWFLVNDVATNYFKEKIAEIARNIGIRALKK